MRVRGVVERAEGCHMEDPEASVNGTGDGGGGEDVEGEEGEARLGFWVEGEEMGRVGAREDGCVD